MEGLLKPVSSKAGLPSKKTYPVSNHSLHKYVANHSAENIIPIIYSKEYDIYFFKLENVHPFDTKKWGKIAKHLTSYFKTKENVDLEFLSPDHMITDEELQVVHSEKFVKRITRSRVAVVMASEVPLLFLLPMCLVRKRLLRPLRWQTSGSVLAGHVALQKGWAINLGGGFHHCSAKKAGGFCLFADISLMIRYLWGQVDQNLKVMIVDLDAHQGNGHENDVLAMNKREQKLIYIMDMFNSYIYPGDNAAKEAINRMIELRPNTTDFKYLDLLSFHLDAALKEFAADLIVYNAGTDILIGDPLGHLDITAKGVAERDEIVFREARGRQIPIVMLTSGGYQGNNGAVIGDSIENLFSKQLIS